MDNILGYKIYDSQYPQMKIIETHKFILRPATQDDADDFYEYLSQEKVVKYLPFKSHKNINDTKKFIQSFFINNYKKGKVGNYAVYLKKDKKVIGNIGINNVYPKSKEAEIGICLNPKYWGHDFSTELVIPVLITGFELMNLDKLIALTYTENIYSPSPLHNVKFKYIKTYKPQNGTQESHRFELTRNEYFSLKKEYLPHLIKTFH